jgi:hypothetical protein
MVQLQGQRLDINRMVLGWNADIRKACRAPAEGAEDRQSGTFCAGQVIEFSFPGRQATGVSLVGLIGSDDVLG